MRVWFVEKGERGVCREGFGEGGERKGDIGSRLKNSERKRAGKREEGAERGRERDVAEKKRGKASALCGLWRGLRID